MAVFPRLHNKSQRRGYLVHEYWDESSEGFGSYARSILYPLLHVSLVNDLQPVFCRDAYRNNTARDYSNLNVSDFLDIATEVPPGNYCEVAINTWSDPVIGSACGDPKVLATLIQDYLKRSRGDKYSPLFLRLVGVLRNMDPTAPVLQWLQDRSVQWMHEDHSATLPWHIAAHVRIPEDFCPQFWKDDNAISKLIQTLEAVEKAGIDINSSRCQLSIYTEQSFSANDEQQITSRWQNAKVFRGTTETLLEDIKAMATADVFIPSSSHLSAMSGYRSHGLIILSDSSRRDYFQSHRDLGCRIVEIGSGEFVSLVKESMRNHSQDDPPRLSHE